MESNYVVPITFNLLLPNPGCIPTPQEILKHTHLNEMTKLYTDIIKSSSSICIENVFLFVYFLHLSSSICLLVLLPVHLSEFSSCPSHMHTAALQFADPSETALKAMMRATLAPLAPPTCAAPHQHGKYMHYRGLPSAGLQYAYVCVRLPLPPSSPPLPPLPSPEVLTGVIPYLLAVCPEADIPCHCTHINSY